MRTDMLEYYIQKRDQYWRLCTPERPQAVLRSTDRSPLVKLALSIVREHDGTVVVYDQRGRVARMCVCENGVFDWRRSAAMEVERERAPVADGFRLVQMQHATAEFILADVEIGQLFLDLAEMANSADDLARNLGHAQRVLHLIDRYLADVGPLSEPLQEARLASESVRRRLAALRDSTRQNPSSLA